MPDNQTARPPQLAFGQVWRSTISGSQEHARRIVSLTLAGQVGFCTASVTNGRPLGSREYVTRVEFRAWVNEHRSRPIEPSDMHNPPGQEPV
jgi:hypothetical protein